MTLTIKGATTIKAATTVGFSPASLFAAGEQGVWYDPSDFSTMFQDTAGTTPVTATGQSVARINDKSGRGNNATQSTAGYRPTLQQDANGCYYLSFDGSDDYLVTGNIDFSSTNKMSLFSGIRKLVKSGGQFIAELSDSISNNNGAFDLVVPNTSPYQGMGYRSKGTTVISADTANNAYPPPVTLVATGLSDISAPSTILRVNGAQAVSDASSQGSGNYGNYPLYIGARGNALTTFNYSGYLYSLIIRGAASTSTQIAAAEGWVNSKTRAY